jgi:hypothetical protein
VSRLYGSIVSLVVCLTVFSPVRQNFAEPPKDDFPLSWFPMFARPRPEYEKVDHVVGFDAEGKRYKVGHTWWTAGGFNQGSTQLRGIRKRGSAALEPFCARVAEKIASRSSDLDAVTEIKIMYGTYSRERWFRYGERKPLREKVVHSCPVVRKAAVR